MSKEVLKNLIDLIDEKNIDEIYQLLIKFIPEDQPFPDEIEAISRGKREVEAGEVENLEDIQWG